MLKKILIGIVTLVVLLAIGLVFLGSNIDSIVKNAVEKYGSAATQTEVKLSSVSISATSGEGSIKNFVMGNPEGFSTESAFKLGLVVIKLDKKTIMGTGPIVINEVLIEAPEVTYEVAARGETNLQKIQNNVTAFANTMTGGALPNEAAKTKGTEKASADSKESRKIIIKSLIVRNGKINLSHELLKGDNAVTADLPLIQLSNLGANQGGVSPALIARDILDRVTSAAISAGQRTLVKQLRQQGLDSLKGAAEESEIGKGVTKALNGIFDK